MKQTIFLAAIAIFFSCNNADKNKDATAPANTAITTAVAENADSSRYMNLETGSGANYQFSKIPNTIMLDNGMKLEFTKIDRMPTPDKLKVKLTIADDKAQQADYELADIELKATNTSSNELKFDANNPMCAEFMLYSKENNYQTYRQQSDLSAGVLYMKTDPMATDKFNAESKSFGALYDAAYKAGETKTGNGIAIPVPKTVGKFGYVSLKTRGGGVYKTFACAVNL